MNLQDVSHIHIPDGDVRMIHDSDNRLLWGAVGYNVLFSGNTFQQSYEGKNMFNKANPPSTLLDASASELETGLRITQTAAGQWKGCIFVLGKASDVAGQTINVHAIATTSAFNLPYCQISLCNASGGDRIRVVNFNRPEIDIAATMPDNPSREYYCLSLLSNGSGTGNIGDYIDYEELMIYLGSTATSYEPYVGGQASPNPDYPQTIQTVTGTQTISINGTNYPISLGTIELCKLGGYQDYIYKDGESWKVHKATATITLTGASSENWYIDQYAYMLNNVISAKAFSDIANMEAYCRSFSKSATGQTSSYAVSFWYNAPGTSVRFIKDQTPDLSSFRNWLASNNQTVYYPLATATDTTITDTTLIAQLEAIYNLVRRYGYNFVVSASGNNLPIIIDRTLL